MRKNVRCCSSMLACALLLGLLSATALAAAPVTYLNETGNTQTCPETPTAVTGSDTTWTAGWYLAGGTITIGSRVTVSGEVHLILADGCALTVTGGIKVTSGDSLTIYAQSDGDSMGKLTADANGDNFAAGIGGNNGEAGGTITINGGAVTANGGHSAAGIGGGEALYDDDSRSYSGGNGGIITINGGTVTATGGSSAAGIGGGLYGSGGAITVNGGTVTGSSAYGGAGIGGGFGGDGGTITINSGTVTAGGGGWGAGIGGGAWDSGGTITISGGTVTATGGTNAAGIGGGGRGSGGAITINGGAVTANGGANAAGIGGGDDGDGGITIGGTITIGSGTIETAGGASGDYGISGYTTLTVLNGATLTIPSGHTLTVPEGATLTVGTDATLINNGTMVVTDDKGVYVNADGALVNLGTINGRYKIAGNVLELWGTGTSDDPYQIPNWETLVAFRNMVNNGTDYADTYFKLTADIDLSSVCGADIRGSEVAWTPIGIGIINNSFNGCFDGGEYTIHGLYINTTSSFQGLFGSLGVDGSISNLCVDGSVKGQGRVGGVCGSSFGTIKNCCYHGSVFGERECGGVCGNASTIINCFNTGAVVGSGNYVGGVCGNVYTIKNCFNTGSVVGSGDYVGGVCGGGSTIQNSYYLDTCGAGGAGTSMTEEQFTSGEVAWLLQGNQLEQVWGQTVPAVNEDIDPFPVLTSNDAKMVYRITFKVDDNEEYAVRYGNPSGLSALPDQPVKNGYTFSGWRMEDTTEFTGGMPLSKDIIVSAQWTADGDSGSDAPKPPVSPVEPAPTPGGGSSYNYFTIDAEAGNGGSIDPSGRVLVREGRDKTFTISPEEGYEVSDMLVDGQSVGAITEYTFEKVNKNHSIEVSFQKVGDFSYMTCPGDNSCPLARFSDVDPMAWYHDGVHYCVQNGLMVGTSATTFAPDMPASRAMIVTILWRQAGCPVVNCLMRYDDVEQDAWYAEAMRWATAEGVVAGYGDGGFGPDDPITREQFTTILYRFDQLQGGGFTGNWMFLLDFTDRSEVSQWAYEAICYMTVHGIIEGKDDKLLDPQGQATRAEIATMLLRHDTMVDNG